jgi:group I intron endonuclease
MYDIYLITNLLDSKKYIGITSKGYKNRFQHHCSQGYYLTSAIKKHGRGNFKLELLMQVETKELAAEHEIRLIKELNTKYPNGYNFSNGGQTPCHTPEVREKISQKLTGRKVSEEHLRKIQENAKKHGEKRRGVPRPKFSKEWKSNISKGAKGKVLSESHKKSISEALRNSEKFRNCTKGTYFKTNNPNNNLELREKIARAKWKPIYCVELDTTFLSSKFAAEVLNIKTNSIATALMRNTKIHNYTFQKVSK